MAEHADSYYFLKIGAEKAWRKIRTLTKEEKTMADEVLYEVKDQIAYITMNRPEKLNAINDAMVALFIKTWERFEQDPEARVAILRGAGRAFCGGADITPGALVPGTVRKAFPANGSQVLKPVIGAVHGLAMGAGSSLAIRGCDLTLATEDAQFGFPEGRAGRVGGIIEYHPYMTFKQSMEFYLLGAWFDAQKACDIGLVNRVVSKEALMTTAREWAEQLKKLAPLSLRIIKYGLYKIMDTPTARAEREYKQFVQPQFESEDFKEAARAFQEKRDPVFKGR
jgi:enoyl-CoA hydratase/carnithine racemase